MVFSVFQVISMWKCMIPDNNFQWETCCLHFEILLNRNWKPFFFSIIFCQHLTVYFWNYTNNEADSDETVTKQSMDASHTW